MAKIKNKSYIGVKQVVEIEVDKNIGIAEDLQHAYTTKDGTIHHNCNGPHVPLCSVDELDTVSGEGLRAFKEIAGMLDSRPNRQALRVGISTRKSRYGLMNQQIEEAEKAGRIVRKWTALEFSQKCPDDRSGVDGAVGYCNQDTLETISEEEYNLKDKQKKNEFIRTELPGSGCLRCPIAPLCLGDAKKQNSTSDMLKPITDTIKKTRENGADWAISQLFNLKPSVEGIVFKEFEEKLHVKSWNEMWKTLTGLDYPGECTHDIFVKKCHSMSMPCFAGVDFGWSNPSTVTYLFVDNRENIYVVRCEGRTYTNNPSWAQTIKNKWHNMYRCQMYFIDLANPGDAEIFKGEGLPCPTSMEKNTAAGIQVIKKWMKSLASPVPKISFAKETCQPIINEFGLYHYKTDAAGVITDDIDKGHDHWIDGIRYAIYALFGKSAAILSDSDMDNRNRLTDQHGNFSRMPSAEEFAATRNLTVIPIHEVDKSKLGEIGNKNQLESDDNGDDGINGNGSFLWSI